MIHKKIKNLFKSSVEYVCSDISNYSIHPNIDFQRNRKKSSQIFIMLYSKVMKDWLLFTGRHRIEIQVSGRAIAVSGAV